MSRVLDSRFHFDKLSVTHGKDNFNGTPMQAYGEFFFYLKTRSFLSALFYVNSISNCVNCLNCSNRLWTSLLVKLTIRSVPNFSTQKEAKVEP